MGNWEENRQLGHSGVSLLLEDAEEALISSNQPSFGVREVF